MENDDAIEADGFVAYHVNLLWRHLIVHHQNHYPLHAKDHVVISHICGDISLLIED
jgi:hypothetical protein